MKIRLLIKGDAIQFGENDFYCPCRTVDVNVTDNLIDTKHEHIIGVEVEPQVESEKVCTYQKTGCESCKYQLYCPRTANEDKT